MNNNSTLGLLFSRSRYDHKCLQVKQILVTWKFANYEDINCGATSAGGDLSIKKRIVKIYFEVNVGKIPNPKDLYSLRSYNTKLQSICLENMPEIGAFPKSGTFCTPNAKYCSICWKFLQKHSKLLKIIKIWVLYLNVDRYRQFPVSIIIDIIIFFPNFWNSFKMSGLHKDFNAWNDGRIVRYKEIHLEFYSNQVNIRYGVTWGQISYQTATAWLI